jgi:hypothetical protein
MLGDVLVGRWNEGRVRFVGDVMVGDIGDVEGIGGRAWFRRVGWIMSWSGGICSLAIFGLIVVFGGVGGAMAGWSAITEGIVYRFAEFLLRPFKYSPLRNTSSVGSVPQLPCITKLWVNVCSRKRGLMENRLLRQLQILFQSEGSGMQATAAAYVQVSTNG